MNRILHVLISISILLCASQVKAQDQGLLLKLNRDFGYGDFSGNIQGRFSLLAEGPPDLVKVEFLFDGQPIAEDLEPPFKLQFSTGDYPLGEHSFSAVGYTTAGGELVSNQLKRNLISSEEAMKGAQQIIFPLLGFIILILILSFTIPTVLSRGKLDHLPLGAQRRYGVFGGAVCPKCNRPYSLHIYGLNMGLSKLDRCPYCGNWRLVRRRSLETLRSAEQAELEHAGADLKPNGFSPEEELQKELDDSRFQDF